MNRLTFLLIAVMLASIPACAASKVRFDKTVELAEGERKIYTFEAPKEDQKVKIEFSATENINLTVFLEKAQDKGKPLAQSSNAKEGSFEVNIPAGESFVIGVASFNKCTLKLKAHSGS